MHAACPYHADDMDTPFLLGTFLCPANDSSSVYVSMCLCTVHGCRCSTSFRSGVGVSQVSKSVCIHFSLFKFQCFVPRVVFVPLVVLSLLVGCGCWLPSLLASSMFRCPPGPSRGPFPLSPMNAIDPGFTRCGFNRGRSG